MVRTIWPRPLLADGCRRLPPASSATPQGHEATHSAILERTGGEPGAWGGEQGVGKEEKASIWDHVGPVGLPQAVNGIPQTVPMPSAAGSGGVAVTRCPTVSSAECSKDQGTRHAGCFKRRRQNKSPHPLPLSGHRPQVGRERGGCTNRFSVPRCPGGQPAVASCDC